MAEEKKTEVAASEKPAAKPQKAASKAPKQAAPKAEEHKKNAEVRQEGFVKSKNSTRLLERYNSEIKQNLMKKFEYKSVMQVPKLNKIVINIGVGDAAQDEKRLDECVEEIALITGQKCIVTKAKKSIAPFKLREGQSIGCKVTLHGVRMYEFFDKLVSIALPRVRDFRGVSKNSFDGRGNYTLGIKEQLIFPEIEYDKVAKVRGMDIVIVTTANSDEEAYALLKELGMPFSK
jgi:large subunit ribosomal protein L5